MYTTETETRRDKAADAKADVDKAQVKKDAAETDERVHEELILPPLRDKKDQAESAESEAEKAKMKRRISLLNWNRKSGIWKIFRKTVRK